MTTPDTNGQQAYTKVPNALLALMASGDMRDTELRVCLAIARQTLGWQREWDKISISQFEDMTGLSRQGVINGIEAALKRGIVERRADGQGFSYRLLVNSVDQLEPKPVNSVDQSTEQTSQLSRPEVVNSVDQLEPKLVNSVDTQKKDIKKRKKERGAHDAPPRSPSHRPRADADPATSAILTAYAEALGYNTINYGKEGQAAKKLAKAGKTPEEVVACYRALKGDAFWADKHLSLQTVYQQIGAWSQNGARPRRPPKPPPEPDQFATADQIREWDEYVARWGHPHAHRHEVD